MPEHTLAAARGGEGTPPMDTAAPPRLSVRGIRKSFAATPAVDEVDLDLHAGEMLALVGANGAGKSTLVKIICGAIAPDAGTITVSGTPIAPRSVADAHAAGIAVAHQQVAIIPCLDGAENIMLGREPVRGRLIDGAALRRAAQALADRFGVAIDLSRECGTLTLGETKILDILKAMAHEPSVLILDEPTASLSLAETGALFRFLGDLKRHGLAILFISHHLNEVFAHCDRVAVMKDGRKVFDGATATCSPAEVVRLMVGRSIAAATQGRAVTHGPVAVALRGARIGRLDVPELVVHRGEIVGLAGVLGAGQTELLERLAGVPTEAHAAEAQVAALKRLPRSVTEAVAAGIYLVADNRLRKALFPGLDVADNLTSGALPLFGPGPFISLRDAVARAAGMIARLRVKCSGPMQDVLQLSGGNQQKLAFGRWLLRMELAARGGGGAAPPLLLLDNPTEGVDVGAKAEIYDLVRDLAAQGAAVLIASAEFAELITLAGRVYCISHGRVGTCLPCAGLTEDRLLLEVA